MKTGEYSKAIHWMVHFDTRDNFPFEYVSGLLDINAKISLSQKCLC